MIPEVEIVRMKSPVLLTGSIVSEDLGGLGGFGGVDENGEENPSARMLEKLP